ncbi:hypothetical protein [Flavobacterium sp.]
MKFTFWLKRVLIVVLAFFVVDFAISEILLNGINKSFGLNDNAEILMNGSSMTMAGFNKIEIEKSTNKKVAFYARNGVSLEDRTAMLKHYFNSTSKKTELVVFEVNPLLFSNRFTADNVYILFLPFMDDEVMNEYVKERTNYREYLIRKFIRTSRYNLDMFSISIKGYLGTYENQKNQNIAPTIIEELKKNPNSVPVEFDKSKFELFKKTLAFTKMNSKKIVLVNMPIFIYKKETFKSNEYDYYISMLKETLKTEKEVYFLDLNDKNMTTNPNYFSDPLHLNYRGQIEVTKSLLKFINENESKK